MCADTTFAQILYLDQYLGLLGLEPMAIIFSLPWALLMWSYVVSSPVSRTLILPICMEILLPRQDGNILHRVVVLLFRHLKPLDTNHCRRDVCPRGGYHCDVPTDRMHRVKACMESVDRWLSTISRRFAETRRWKCRVPHSFRTWSP
jgi:hypothetical protein